MDHTGGYYMAIALLAALYHQRRTGEGQWVDVSCIEARHRLTGPAVLDCTVNGRPLREDGRDRTPTADPSPPMAPHGIYPCRDEDNWVAIACRHDEDWAALADVIGEAWAKDAALATAGRPARRPGRASTASSAAWTARPRPRRVVAARAGRRRPGGARAPGRRSASTATPTPRPGGCGRRSSTPSTAASGSTACPCTCRRTEWRIERGGPVLGQDNEQVFGEVLGLSPAEIAELRAEGVI